MGNQEAYQCVHQIKFKEQHQQPILLYQFSQQVVLK